MAPSRHDLGREPWHNPRRLLPRRASSSRAPGRGQGADRLAFAPGCKNSLLSDCPRDHVGSNAWARAGRRRGHPCASEAGSPTHFATTPWSHSARRSRAPHGEGGCGDCMARDALLSIKTGRPNSRSQPERSMTSSKSPHSARHGAVIEDRSPLFARRLLRPARIAGTDIHRASLARPPARRRLRRATTRPDEIQHIDPRARRRMSIRFVR